MITTSELSQEQLNEILVMMFLQAVYNAGGRIALKSDELQAFSKQDINLDFGYASEDPNILIVTVAVGEKEE